MWGTECLLKSGNVRRKQEREEGSLRKFGEEVRSRCVRSVESTDIRYQPIHCKSLIARAMDAHRGFPRIMLNDFLHLHKL